MRIPFDGNDQHLVRDVIALPLRIGACAIRLGFRVAEQTATVALRATEWLVEAAVPPPRERPGARVDGEVSSSIQFRVAEPPPIYETPSTPAPTPTAEAPPTEAIPAAHVSEEVRLTPSTPPPTPTAEAPPTEAIPAAHVSEEVELVESFAEPGAEDGAGAAVHVEEPWKRYGQMTAKQIIARLADASREELAAVELYERVHRGRQTVLGAADRHLRRATAAARDRK